MKGQSLAIYLGVIVHIDDYECMYLLWVYIYICMYIYIYIILFFYVVSSSSNTMSTLFVLFAFATCSMCFFMSASHPFGMLSSY